MLSDTVVALPDGWLGFVHPTCIVHPRVFRVGDPLWEYAVGATTESPSATKSKSSEVDAGLAPDSTCKFSQLNIQLALFKPT